MITCKEINAMTNDELDKHYADLFSKIKRDGNGKPTNLQYISIGNRSDNEEDNFWLDTTDQNFNLRKFYYRLKPEEIIVDMIDEECRIFIRDNITRILIRRKNTYGIDKPASAYLDCSFIASHNVFCFIEDFNCKEPDETVWKEFKKTVTE